MGTKPSFSRVLDVLKILLVLISWTGQCWKGIFSSTKNWLWRTKRRSLWWLIVYHGRSVGGIHKVEIKGELLLSAEGATQRILWLPGGRERKSSKLLTRRERPSQMSWMIWKKKRARIDTFVPLRNQRMNTLRKQKQQANWPSSPNPTVAAKLQKEENASLLEIGKKIDKKLAEMKK